MAFRRPIFVLAVAALAAVAQDTPKVTAPEKPDDQPSGQPGQPQGDRPRRSEGFPRAGGPPGRPDGAGPSGDRPDGPRREGGRDGRHGPPKLPDEKTSKENFEKTLETLTPEKRKELWGAVSILNGVPPDQRGDFWRTVWAVSFMSQEQRTDIIGKGEERKKAMREEVDRVYKDVGLTKEDPRRREFFFRYFEERRKLEAQLSKETDERRKVLLKDMEEKLKANFAKPATEKVDAK